MCRSLVNQNLLWCGRNSTRACFLLKITSLSAWSPQTPQAVGEEPWFIRRAGCPRSWRDITTAPDDHLLFSWYRLNIIFILLSSPRPVCKQSQMEIWHVTRFNEKKVQCRDTIFKKSSLKFSENKKKKGVGLELRNCWCSLLRSLTYFFYTWSLFLITLYIYLIPPTVFLLIYLFFAHSFGEMF